MENDKASTGGSKQLPGDVYKRAVECEEAEARSRTADDDLFIKICQDIRQLISDVVEFKKKKSDEAEINSKRVEASLLAVALNKLNRLEKIHTKAVRDALHQQKKQINKLNSQLQNLLNEVAHRDTTND